MTPSRKWRRKAANLAAATLCFTAAVAAVLALEALLASTDQQPHIIHQLATNESQTHNATTTPQPRKSLRAKLDNVVVLSSCTLAALLLSGHLIRRHSRWVRAFHLPSSVLGGIIGWLFFAVIELFDGDAPDGGIDEAWFSVGWNVLPSICTDIVFSCLFLGTRVPRLADILASPRREHFLYGLIVVFGQYAVSCVLTILCRLADPSLAAPFATVMPYGYAGGPVVAEAMKPLYAEDSFNYTDGYTLALLAATVGMFAGVITGAILVNMAPLQNSLHVRSGQGGASSMSCVAYMRRLGAAMIELKATATQSDMYSARERARYPVMEQTVSLESLDSLAFHLCLVGMVMLCASALRLPFVLLEEAFPQGSFLEKSNLLSVLPLFLFCLLSSLAFQKAVDARFTDAATGKSFVDRPTVSRISNTAQDVLIVAAISRLGRNGLPPGVHGLGPFFNIIFARGLPFVIVCVGGIVWGVLSFWYLAPRLLPDFWPERALVEFGVSIGATSTGLLLLRMADPEGKSPVLQDFTFKQIFHVLITGGGFFDVLVPIPLTAATGSAWPLLVVVCLIIAGLLFCHPASRRHFPCRGRDLAGPTSTMAAPTTSTAIVVAPGDEPVIEVVSRDVLEERELEADASTSESTPNESESPRPTQPANSRAFPEDSAAPVRQRGGKPRELDVGGGPL